MILARILLMLTVFIALSYTACADMIVYPGEIITLTGPDPAQSGVTYHYQWTVTANGVNINDQLTSIGQPVNTSQKVLCFDAPWFSQATPLTIHLWICALKQGGSQLDGCVDTADAPAIMVETTSCQFVSGYIGDRCSAYTTADAYSYTRNPSGLILKWYLDDSTEPYATGASTSIVWSSKGLGAHHLTLKVWHASDPNTLRFDCVRNVFVVGVPDATISVT